MGPLSSAPATGVVAGGSARNVSVPRADLVGAGAPRPTDVSGCGGTLEDLEGLEDGMAPMDELLLYWHGACERKDLTKMVAEVVVPDPMQSQAARFGREFLLACALGPRETDEVLSEIALLTVADDGEDTWRLKRLSGQQAAAITGGHLTAHFAKSFILATWLRSPAAMKPKRARIRAQPLD